MMNKSVLYVLENLLGKHNVSIIKFNQFLLIHNLNNQKK